MGVLKHNSSSDFELGRIIGGSDALPGEFSHQIQLKYFGDHLCGASLISTFLVLTAAHCVMHKSPRRVKAVSGEHRLSLNESTEQYRDVRLIFTHELYNDKTFDNDIALLLLSNEVLIDNVTKIISLPDEHTKFEDEAIVTGWGRMLERVYSPADALQKVKVPIIPRATCKESYELILRNITDKQICAGAHRKDSCKADSGGPLTCTGEDGATKYLCGIVSYGFGCGRERWPGVYTNVGMYRDWIDGKISEIEKNSFCPEDSFRCAKQHDCIDLNFRCDDDADCSDGTDESPKLCKDKRRNGCRLSQFRCVTSGECLSYLKRCNGVNDCGDGSDEANCIGDSSEVNSTALALGVVSTVATILPLATSTLTNPVVTPTVEGTTMKITSKPPLTAVPFTDVSNSVTSEGTVIDFISTTSTPEGATLQELIPSTAPSSTEPITTVPTYTTQETSTLDLAPTITVTETPAFSHCPRTFFQCLNLKCIPSSFLCDQENDCGDNSDEDCPTISESSNGTISNSSHICNAEQFQCISSKRCVPLAFKCDGESDCGAEDTSDEDGCSASQRTCASNQFQCEKGGSCIPSRWECDKEFDCEDHSDERGCEEVVPASTLATSAPTIASTTSATPIIGSTPNIPSSTPCPSLGNCVEENETLKPLGKCGRFKFECGNRECISNRWRCDGHKDCIDGSDERNCF